MPRAGQPSTVSLAADLLAVSGARFVSLTTFRRSDVAVSTPAWIVRDGDALRVTTPGDSGKLKRLRNDARVELRPCAGAAKSPPTPPRPSERPPSTPTMPARGLSGSGHP